MSEEFRILRSRTAGAGKTKILMLDAWNADEWGLLQREIKDVKPCSLSAVRPPTISLDGPSHGKSSFHESIFDLLKNDFPEPTKLIGLRTEWMEGAMASAGFVQEEGTHGMKHGEHMTAILKPRAYRLDRLVILDEISYRLCVELETGLACEFPPVVDEGTLFRQKEAIVSAIKNAESILWSLRLDESPRLPARPQRRLLVHAMDPMPLA